MYDIGPRHRLSKEQHGRRGSGRAQQPVRKVGDNNRALAALEKALAERSPRLLFVRVEPRFDPLRSHSGFQALIKRVGQLK